MSLGSSEFRQIEKIIASAEVEHAPDRYPFDAEAGFPIWASAGRVSSTRRIGIGDGPRSVEADEEINRKARDEPAQGGG
jgi:hypothetical protein